MNSIFEFATKELSQDAVICWMLNWIKYPESELFELGKGLYSLLGEENTDFNQDITIKTQVKKADIVVVLHKDKRIIIIEDKVYSTEHDDQIAKYKKELANESVQRELGIKGELISDIKTVYFKTGFFYDEDKLILENKKADIVITGPMFLDLISKYVEETDSEILISYHDHLTKMMDYCAKYGDFTGEYSDGGYYVSWETIAQYELMRTIFPEDMWNKNTDEYKVYSGSSKGRPWTETCICPRKLYSNGEDYYVFWKIDSDKNGPYLSLRYYDSYTKGKDSHGLERHKRYYEALVTYVKCIIESNRAGTLFVWNDVECGYKGSYKESSLISIHLAEYLENWNKMSEYLIKTIRMITAEFVSGLDSVLEGIMG